MKKSKMKKTMMVALIHWRIKTDKASIAAFLQHWKTRNAIKNTKGLIAEFLSDSLPMANYPYITWHLDGDALGDFKSYVTVGLWADGEEFKRQIAKYFNDKKPMLDFEKYRRRRVVFRPVEWRVGKRVLPKKHSSGVV